MYIATQNTVFEDFSQANPESVLKSASAKHSSQFYAMTPCPMNTQLIDNRIYGAYL